MRARTISVGALTTSLLLTACQPRWGFQDLYDPSQTSVYSNHYAVFETAPNVVVGVVTSVAVIGEPQPARRDQKLLVQLTKVDIQVENVLRGDVPRAPAHFYFFGYSDKNPGYGGPPLYRVSIGDRRVFFLVREMGELRSAADVFDYTLFVASGSHKDLPFGKDTPLGDVIAEVLLSLGDGYDSADMRSILPLSCRVLDQLSSRRHTVALLRKLLEARDRDLAVATCLYLSENYNGQYGCLSDLLSSQGLDAPLRAQAEKILNAARDRSADLKLRLRQFPLYAFSSSPFPDSLETIRQELTFLLDDRDPEMRSIACGELTRTYPYPEPRCAGGLRPRSIP